MSGRTSRAVSRIFIERLGFGDLLEVFLVAAVGCVLTIRFMLAATGYPQLGGGGLHIAHMLWGGLGMLVALLLVFVSLSRGGFFAAALIGGLGFGAFIDEIGKFVTSNNDYFYRPAVAMIYVAFMLLYLAGRMIEHLVRPASRTYLANALEILKEAAARDLTTQEMERARAYLREAGPEEPLAPAISAVLDRAEAIPPNPPGLFARAGHRAHDLYTKVAYTRMFMSVVIWIFVVLALVTMVASMLNVGGVTGIIISALIAIGLAAALVHTLRSTQSRKRKATLAAVLLVVAAALIAAALWQAPSARLHTIGFVGWADLVSSIAVGLLVLVGVWQLQVSRLAGYRWFLRAILFDILFAQVFAFYREQFWAIIGLLISILIWAIIHYAVLEEETAELTAAHAAEGAQVVPASANVLTAAAGTPPA